MKNVHLQYEVTIPSEVDKNGNVTTPESAFQSQAYIKAADYKEAEVKLEKYLGKKVSFKITSFNDANAEVIE